LTLASEKVWVQLNSEGKAWRIFRSKKAASKFFIKNPDANIRFMGYAQAVGEIRRQVFERDGYTCVKCGLPVIWERGQRNSGEMDERQARGKCVETESGDYLSGEVSVENGQTLCRACHTGPGGKQDRSPDFTKAKELLNLKLAEPLQDDEIIGWVNPEQVGTE
jgi:hypothetical protein